MVYDDIAAGDFFTDSPRIRIQKNPAVAGIVEEAKAWIAQHSEKGGLRNCQLRPASDEERDGHFIRLVGVQKMHDMLLELKDKTDYKLIYHKKETPWAVLDKQHPCGMLSYNDKWSMISWDNANLSRYGDKKRKELSCIPVEMEGGNWHGLSVELCKYCNGEYDKTVHVGR